MPRVHYVNIFTDQFGVGVTGAIATVLPRNAATPTNVYLNANGSTVLTTPLFTTNGKIEFWMDEGAYNITINGTGFQDFTHYWDAVSAQTTTQLKTQAVDRGYSGLRAFGHSLVSAKLPPEQVGLTGVSDRKFRYSTRLAGMLHVPEDNRAESGGILGQINTNPGSYANLLQYISGYARIATGGAANIALATPQIKFPISNESLPYSVNLMHYGINDAGNAFVSLAAWINAMRTIFVRIRAALIIENTHASVGAGGTTVLSQDRNSGYSFRQMSNGQTITISGNPLDSTFPGGILWLRHIMQTSDVASVAVTIDGVSQGSISLNASGNINSQASQAGPRVDKFVLAPGAHTILLTYSVTTGKGQFDGYDIELTNVPVPTIVVPNIHKLTSAYYNFYYGSPNINDAKVDTWNTFLLALIGEFTDGKIVYVDIDTLINKTNNLADGLHPDDYGAALVAERIMQSLPSLSTTDQSRSTIGVETGDWVNLKLESGWIPRAAHTGGSAFNTLQATPTWRKDASGYVHLQGLVSANTQLAINNAVIAYLPLGARPEVFHQYYVTSELGLARVDIQPYANPTGTTFPGGGLRYVSGATGFAGTAATPVAGSSMDLACIPPFRADPNY